MSSECIQNATKRLLRLIRSRERALDQCKIVHDRQSAAIAVLKKVGVAHAIPHHARPQEQDWWEWSTDGTSYCWKWVPPPDEPLYPEIGQRLYAAERRMYTTSPRLRRINEAIALELGFEVDRADSNLLR